MVDCKLKSGDTRKKSFLKEKFTINSRSEKCAPDYPLFLKGARRVGKTTIAEEFGEKEYKSLRYAIKSSESDRTVVRENFVSTARYAEIDRARERYSLECYVDFTENEVKIPCRK